ncbi:MAG: extracellular solute-binding protein [Clostridia bacterium]
MTKTWQKVLTASLAAMMLAGSLAGCGSKTASINLENPEVTVMTKSFNPDPAPADSEVVKALEEVLGTKVNFSWVPSSNYEEKVTAAMGSGEYPHIMLVGSRSSSVIQNCRAGSFWDITDKITDASKYPNLAQSNPDVLHNISIDGKVYGVYRARELGRAGVSIRKDWLDNLGMDIPTTIDEFYNVLKAFKEQDPDKNGQDDTYGMIVTNYLDGPLNNIAIWMGAPNQWGLNEETNQLEPAFMFSEFKDALDFMRKCYEEGLINQDMATYASDKWNEQFLSGKAGVIIDVADRARRLAQNVTGINPEAKVDVFGYVKRDAESEPKTLPTTGYDGFYVFPKQSVHTEEDLDFLLGVLDKACGQEASDLMNYGILDRNYTIEDGYAVKTDDAALLKEYADLNQFAPGIVTFPDGLKTKYDTDVAEKVQAVYDENKLYTVANPAEPYVSDTYSTKGPQLDAIMAEANTKYICGQISEDEWLAQVERWRSQGGDKVIEEMNAAYKADSSVQK